MSLETANQSKFIKLFSQYWLIRWLMNSSSGIGELEKYLFANISANSWFDQCMIWSIIELKRIDEFRRFCSDVIDQRFDVGGESKMQIFQQLVNEKRRRWIHLEMGVFWQHMGKHFVSNGHIYIIAAKLVKWHYFQFPFQLPMFCSVFNPKYLLVFQYNILQNVMWRI